MNNFDIENILYNILEERGLDQRLDYYNLVAKIMDEIYEREEFAIEDVDLTLKKVERYISKFLN
jgi:hypothetical protein